MKTITKDEVANFILYVTSYLYEELCEERCKIENQKCLEESFNTIMEKLEVNNYNFETFTGDLKDIKEQLDLDIDAAFYGDPASKSKEEIIITYPGFYATMIYRIAHLFYKLNLPIFPRMLSEYAHSKTGIDINPGASIGKHFFIDHGTGVVIGETAIIGDNVRLYQGVTLGALSVSKVESLRNVKRHPTIKNNVTIYSGASILGGETIIGNNVTIGSNVFITESIEDNKRVRFTKNNYEIFDKTIKKEG